ncbi:hypothetical protein [Burkholderia gladioli]|uniref:hypothetical protein n=1 Tax=Burkholderia gladioli TaxID=28095 RepID=UPI000D007B62|nr:hypothetical protein [Burkholderia gladioli]MBU9276785.1 hypothetical protein [Burkholderia gladioli]PRG56286.1 hypothetical protein C6V06_05395 [Burkholderia gladioli]
MHDLLLVIHALDHLILTAGTHPASALLAIVLVASSGGLFVAFAAAQLAGRSLGRAGGAGTTRRRRRRREQGRETKSHT